MLRSGSSGSSSRPAALPKANGLFTNFGDVAILSAFTVLVILLFNKHELPLKIGTRGSRLALAEITIPRRSELIAAEEPGFLYVR